MKIRLENRCYHSDMKNSFSILPGKSTLMNIVIRSFLIVVMLNTFSSCKKFLDIDSPNDVNSDHVITSGDGLISARIGMYNSLQSDAYYGGYFPLMIDAYSDNGAAGGYDSPQLNQFNDKSLGADNIFIDNFWVAAYNAVYTANQILANVDAIEDPSLMDEVRSDVKGEALTVRAMAHFDLLRTFGEHWDVNSNLGIPLVLDATDPLQARGRNTVQECYDAILADLNNALVLVSNDDVEAGDGSKTPAYITQYFVNGLLARVYLYMQDYENASVKAAGVINDDIFIVVNNPALIYTTKLSSESIFELQFNVQDQSQYNNLTYVRGDALRVDVSFLANENLHEFFLNRPGDVRAASVDFDPEHNDGSIQPDGRTEKYRGEETKDNSAYIMRISEMYLIAAEAKGVSGGGVDDLNALRHNRGLGDLFPEDFDTPEAFMNTVQDERRAELNFEGHRYFDLARIGKVSEVIGESVLPVFPIPVNQITASGGAITQYPGY